MTAGIRPPIRPPGWPDQHYEHFEQMASAICEAQLSLRHEQVWQDFWGQPVYQWLRAHDVERSLSTLRRSKARGTEKLFLLRAIARTVQLYCVTMQGSHRKLPDSRTRAKAKKHVDGLLALREEGISLRQPQGPFKQREALWQEYQTEEAFWRHLGNLSQQLTTAPRKKRQDDGTAEREALTVLAVGILQHLKKPPTLTILRHVADMLGTERDDAQIKDYIIHAKKLLRNRSPSK
jgi:hypothetical protein